MEQDNKTNNPTTENNNIGYDEMEAVFKDKAQQEAEREAQREAEEEAQKLYEALGEINVENPEVEESEPETVPEPKEKSAQQKKPKKKKKRKKGTNWLARIFVFIICVAACIAILHIEYFDVKTVNVTGNDLLTQEQVLKGTKIKTGNNIFDIFGFIEEGKIEKNPYIKSVSIHKKLPDVINVEVAEYAGMAQFVMGNKFVVTDNEGTVLKVCKSQERIVLITGVGVKEATVGSSIVLAKGQDKVFEQAMEIVAAASENDMFFKRIEINNDRVDAYIYDGLVAKGSVINMVDSLNAGALRTVAYDLYQKDVKKGVINVSADNYCSFTKK